MKTVAAISAFVLGLSSAAFAADLPTAKPAAPAPIMATTWTGFYIGAFGGYGAGNASITPDAFLTSLGSYPVTLDPRGGFVGADIGYNYQTASGFVYGAVADIAWADLTGTTCVDVHFCSGSPTDSYARGTVQWLSTLRAKAGFAVTNDALLYATGGLAVAGTRGYDSYVDSVNGMTAYATHVGWTIGAGLDYRLTSSLFLEAEYLYADLGTQNYNYSISPTSPLFGTDLATNVDLKVNLFKAGIGYKF